jgi:hypothetical protein
MTAGAVPADTRKYRTKPDGNRAGIQKEEFRCAAYQLSAGQASRWQ